MSARAHAAICVRACVSEARVIETPGGGCCRAAGDQKQRAGAGACKLTDHERRTRAVLSGRSQPTCAPKFLRRQPISPRHRFLLSFHLVPAASRGASHHKPSSPSRALVRGERRPTPQQRDCSRRVRGAAALGRRRPPPPLLSNARRWPAPPPPLPLRRARRARSTASSCVRRARCTRWAGSWPSASLWTARPGWRTGGGTAGQSRTATITQTRCAACCPGSQRQACVRVHGCRVC